MFLFNYNNRDFISSYYGQIKSSHPQLPILIRESNNTNAMAYFVDIKDGLKEECIDLKNLSKEEIMKIFSKL